MPALARVSHRLGLSATCLVMTVARLYGGDNRNMTCAYGKRRAVVDTAFLYPIWLPEVKGWHRFLSLFPNSCVRNNLRFA